MRKVLRKGFQKIEILKRHESRPGESFKIFRDRFSALNYLNPFMRDPLSIINIRRNLCGSSLNRDFFRLSDHQVLEQLAWRLASGQFMIVELPLEMPVWGYIEPEDEEEEAAAEAVVPATEHWIKLQIVDDDTNEPVEGVPLKIKLPTGEVKEFKSDKNGTVEVKGVPEGTWDIEEMLDSDALEVVEVA